MLTLELLNGNATLAGLTDEQLGAIVEMSRNDENTVIGQKTAEIYNGLDADILAASGIGKEGTEKTYDYAKRVIGAIKTKAESASQLQAQVTELGKEKARLEALVAKGGSDEETKRQLEQAKADLSNVTREYTELKTKYDNAETEHAKALLDVRMDGEFAKASAGLKFKANLPASVTSVLMAQAVAKVKGMSPEYIDNGAGAKVLAFKDSTGAIMRNPATNLNPYTAEELLAKELKTMGVLEEGRKQTGTGSPTTEVIVGADGSVDVSGAKTQTEAQNMISRALLAQGLTIASPAYQQAFDKAWKDNLATLKALPIK